jgi:hypothetical protein
MSEWLRKKQQFHQLGSNLDLSSRLSVVGLAKVAAEQKYVIVEFISKE